MRSLLAAALLAALAPAAGAQFPNFNWTLDNDAGCLFAAYPDSILFGGGSNSGGPSTYSTQLSYDAFVTVRITTMATPKGDCGDSHAVWGTWEKLNNFSDCFSATVTFTVPKGGSIVFGHKVLVNTLPGDSYFSQFFVRPFWTNVGHALWGENGEPLLQGEGVPEAGGVVKLQVSGAVPLAPAALVIGLSQASLPFKGGMLVPQPDVLVNLVTSATGGIALSSHWPAGLPAGFPILMQTWVVDAGGPAGFAATNAMMVFGV